MFSYFLCTFSNILESRRTTGFPSNYEGGTNISFFLLTVAAPIFPFFHTSYFLATTPAHVVVSLIVGLCLSGWFSSTSLIFSLCSKCNRSSFYSLYSYSPRSMLFFISRGCLFRYAMFISLQNPNRIYYHSNLISTLNYVILY